MRGEIFPFLSFGLKADKSLVIQAVQQKGSLLQLLGTVTEVGHPCKPKPFTLGRFWGL